MILVALSDEQLSEIIKSAPMADSSVRFLSLVFVSGLPVAQAAKMANLSPSRGYNLAADFRKRYTEWLQSSGMRPVIAFVPATET